MPNAIAELDDQYVVGTRAWRERQAKMKRQKQWICLASCFIVGICALAAGVVLIVIRHGVGPVQGRAASDTCILPNDRQQHVIPGTDYRCNPLYTTYTDVAGPLLVLGGIVVLVAAGVAWSKRRDERRSGVRFMS